MHARESFWFLPTLFGAGAILLALALIEFDRLLVESDSVSIPLLTNLSVTGGRAILTVIGGTMLGVAATSFSITISVLATTSSTYGPRLVRNFMADRGNQMVLAVLTSTFLYTLIVLRAVRTEQESAVAFVPGVAVSFSVLLAICDVAVLVYFIHHIASSVQVTTLQGRVLDELTAAIDLIYPSNPEPVPAAVLGRDSELRVQRMFLATSTGYVQYVDVNRLVRTAAATDSMIEVLAPPGTHVLAGHPLAQQLVPAHAARHTLATETDSEQSTSASAVIGAYIVGPSRTPRQDLRFAAQGLIETGIRGLATGTNDPYTAVTAIDTLSSALVTLYARPPASPFSCDADGNTRVRCDWPMPERILSDALLALRTYGMQHPLVIEAALRLVSRVEAVATGDERMHLRHELDALRVAYLAAAPAQIDAEPLLQALDVLLDRLDSDVPQMP